MIIILKKIKFLIIHSRFTTFFVLFLKNLINLNIFYYFFKKKKIYSLGNFSSYLNPFIFEELLLIDDSKNHDIDYIQSFRVFLDDKTEFFLHDIKSNILPLFLKKTLKKKIFTNFRKNFYHKKNNENDNRKILISDNINKLEAKLKDFDLIFSNLKIENNEFKYSYKFDIFGKIHSHRANVLTKYYILSKTKLLNSINKNSITAISLLKDLDIYPFDICFESILPFVDEFILGIDKKSYNNKYKKILDTFLKQTKYKKKIKVKFFNFHTETSKDCHIRARWIADVNNKLCNYVKTKYLCYIQADEIFDYDLNKDFKEIVKKNYDELNINFLHFIYDFDHIRDPKFAAYNNLGRVYKRNFFISTHDGCGFKKINNRRSNLKFSLNNIYHIGYIYNYKKKIYKNINSRTAIFRTSKKNFFDNLNLIKISHKNKSKLVKTIDRYKYLKGYKNLKKFI